MIVPFFRRLAMISILAAVSSTASAAPHAEYSGVPDPIAPFVSVNGGISFTGGYYLSQTEAGTPLGGGKYNISARIRTFRFQDSFHGTREEYSAALTRELFHGTILGRLGTSPPSMETAGYHLASGEAWFYFYGLTLGPEHPELAQKVWESSGPAPTAESLDQTWVTRLGGVYENINNHLQLPKQILVVVENSWQFELDETWRRNTMVGVLMGFDRYNRTLANNAATILKDDIDFAGNMLPLPGWPNNWGSARLAQRVGTVTLSAAGTRLNLLNNALEVFYSTQADWNVGRGWSVRLGYEHRRRRRAVTREGMFLGFLRRW